MPYIGADYVRQGGRRIVFLMIIKETGTSVRYVVYTHEEEQVTRGGGDGVHTLVFKDPDWRRRLRRLTKTTEDVVDDVMEPQGGKKGVRKRKKTPREWQQDGEDGEYVLLYISGYIPYSCPPDVPPYEHMPGERMMATLRGTEKEIQSSYTRPLRLQGVMRREAYIYITLVIYIKSNSGGLLSC